jgi:hypothetical protein
MTAIYIFFKKVLPHVIASETKQSVGLKERSLKAKGQKKPHPSVIASETKQSVGLMKRSLKVKIRKLSLKTLSRKQTDCFTTFAMT